jgi:hypothetical protein
MKSFPSLNHVNQTDLRLPALGAAVEYRQLIAVLCTLPHTAQ